MKAIIMAGGEGRRLKPVSGDMPKPLVPLCGRSIMEHIIELLKSCGISDLCAALKYRPGDIMSTFGDGSALGVKLQYRIEQEALGTAGGVKNCADFYGDEDFLVISGDAACDFDLKLLIEAHKKNMPAVTMALYPHEQPLQYGLALCDSSNCVHSFIEKPDWAHVVTNLVNTGIYIISPQAMELVPDGQVFDFAKDLFPLLLKNGMKIYGQPMDGYWCDIGTPLSYYQCCVDALCGRLKITPADAFRLESRASSCETREKSMHERTFACRDRARLMGRLSGMFLSYGADFTDGIYLSGSDYELRIFPEAASARLRVCANAHTMEAAEELVSSARELVFNVEKSLDN